MARPEITCHICQYDPNDALADKPSEKTFIRDGFHRKRDSLSDFCWQLCSGLRQEL